MSGKRAYMAMAVRRLCPTTGFHERWDLADILPRSRLYALSPREVGTVWGESLVSYISRLGWVHRVTPRALVAREIVPRLGNAEVFRSSPTLLSALGRRGGMLINGTGDTAQEWATVLEQLTTRTDLHHLTLHQWVGDISVREIFRAAPAWCPLCYTEWKQQGLAIYQPLVWMLKLILLCPRHQRRLEEYCPQCHKAQSVIAANKTQPGECTQCGAWLGTGGIAQNPHERNEEVMWQAWVLHSLEELYLAASRRSWERLITGLMTFLEKPGGYSKLARLAGMDRTALYLWFSDESKSYHRMPSLETVLKLCYAWDITPLQVMENDVVSFQQTLQDEKPIRLVRKRQFVGCRRDQVDRERCQRLIQAVLEGEEEPLGVCQIAKRLGYDVRQLKYYFPQECQVLTQRAKEYRKQRAEQYVVQACDEVQQVVMTLHAQGIFPSYKKVSAQLSNPALFLMPQVRSTWRATRQALGLEPSKDGST